MVSVAQVQSEIPAERIYAGVLGKLIGVYHGRPVEGWSYDSIRSRFGTVERYVAAALGVPLVVPDDDISGTLVFARALEDNLDRPEPVTAKSVGDTWLNYIVEDRTVLWWGGLGRSTEHTAYLRLKAGIDAPRSGSAALNGRTAAEQIGAQIFIDGWALLNPGDPERAIAMARAAASVSHDGLAVSAACLLAAMEAMAFEERNMHVLIAKGLDLVQDPALRSLVESVVERCMSSGDWRDVRDWIAAEHGYERYGGVCPMATNHAAIMMALLLGGDDFHRSVVIATSAGWDTDCNAGNVGCLNGIRLGLDGIDAGVDLRGPVGDRLYAVSADGGSCVSDAVLETRSLVAGASALASSAVGAWSPTAPGDRARFAFEYRGSTQGFAPAPDVPAPDAPGPAVRAERAMSGGTEGPNVAVVDNPDGAGLRIGFRRLGAGVHATVATETFPESLAVAAAPSGSYAMLASPTIYPTQTVSVRVRAGEAAPVLRCFVDAADDDGRVQRHFGAAHQLTEGTADLGYTVPDLGGNIVLRLGIELRSDRCLDGSVLVESIHWHGAPKDYELGAALAMSPTMMPWSRTAWLKSFVASASHFTADVSATFAISHHAANGVVTTGTREWDHYGVSSVLTPGMQQGFGLVARARGHRRYYAGVIAGGQARLVRRRDAEVVVLASAPFLGAPEQPVAMDLRVVGTHLELRLGGELIAEADDTLYPSGGAGFVVDEGMVLARGFRVRAHPRVV